VDRPDHCSPLHDWTKTEKGSLSRNLPGPAQLAYRILFAHSGIAIVGLAIAIAIAIALMQYMDQIRCPPPLRHQSIASIIEQEHSSLVYPGYISFPGIGHVGEARVRDSG